MTDVCQHEYRALGKPFEHLQDSICEVNFLSIEKSHLILSSTIFCWRSFNKNFKFQLTAVTYSTYKNMNPLA